MREVGGGVEGLGGKGVVLCVFCVFYVFVVFCCHVVLKLIAVTFLKD